MDVRKKLFKQTAITIMEQNNDDQVYKIASIAFAVFNNQLPL